MLKQYRRKKRKILKGFVRTKLQKHGTPFDANSWFDVEVYGCGVSDKQTISHRHSEMLSLYHYSSVEQLILRHLLNNNIATENIRVLDIGSGAGHWINFGRNLVQLQLMESTFHAPQRIICEKNTLPRNQSKFITDVRLILLRRSIENFQRSVRSALCFISLTTKSGLTPYLLLETASKRGEFS